MDLNFNKLFGKESADLKIKDFPELPMIEGLEISSDSAGLYKKKRNDTCFFFLQRWSFLCRSVYKILSKIALYRLESKN